MPYVGVVVVELVVVNRCVLYCVIHSTGVLVTRVGIV